MGVPTQACVTASHLQGIAKAIDDGDRRPPSQTHEQRDAHCIPVGELTESARLQQAEMPGPDCSPPQDRCDGYSTLLRTPHECMHSSIQV